MDVETKNEKYWTKNIEKPNRNGNGYSSSTSRLTHTATHRHTHTHTLIQNTFSLPFQFTIVLIVRVRSTLLSNLQSFLQTKRAANAGSFSRSSSHLVCCIDVVGTVAAVDAYAQRNASRSMHTHTHIYERPNSDSHSDSHSHSQALTRSRNNVRKEEKCVHGRDRTDKYSHFQTNVYICIHRVNDGVMNWTIFFLRQFPLIALF